jgi:hypothetical protein
MDTMTGTTARPVTFTLVDQSKRVVQTHTAPAGTEVYASERRDGKLNIRIPGTLLTQVVSFATVVPA